MRVLFDNGTPRGVAAVLADRYTVEEARSPGWDILRNASCWTLARRLESICSPRQTDWNIRYQQDLTGRKLAIVVLGKAR